MVKFRRVFLPGASYFFTVNLNNRHQKLLVEHINLLRNAVAVVKQKHPFHIDAWVVLPDHIHAVWTLPEGDSNYSARWRAIKTRFSQGILWGEKRSLANIQQKERGIWQRRFWEHTIRDQGDFHRHVNYVHLNPVKHKLVRNVADWPYSSFHRAVRQGIYPKNWYSTSPESSDLNHGYGERE